MSEESSESKKAAVPAAEKPAESSYTPAEWKLRVRAQLGVSPHLLAGALHDAAPDQLLTEEQVRSKLKSYAPESLR